MGAQRTSQTDRRRHHRKRNPTDREKDQQERGRIRGFRRGEIARRHIPLTSVFAGLKTKYENTVRIHRPLLYPDGEGIFQTGKTYHLLATDLGGDADAGTQFDRDRRNHFGLYGCRHHNPDGPQLRVALHSPVPHRIRRTGVHAPRIQLDDRRPDSGRKGRFEHRFRNRNHAHHRTDRRPRNHGGQLGQLPDSAENHQYGDLFPVSDYTEYGNRYCRRLCTLHPNRSRQSGCLHHRYPI